MAAPIPAWADRSTEAGFHFRRGMELVGKRQYRQALESFFTSNRLSANPSVVNNIGLCLELLGEHDDAFSYFSEFRGLAKEAEDVADAEAALARVLPRVARLHVRSTPPGATIWVDRKNLGDVGRTPRLFAAEQGGHTIFVELPGYRPAQAKVVLRTGERVEAKFALERVTGSVAVASTPPGAEIRRGDQLLGTTPAEVRLAPGRHTLTLALDGHAAGEADVEVVADGAAEVTVALSKLPPPVGRLTVTANRPGATVKVDGAVAGFTPIVLDQVVVGRHELAVEADGQRPWTAEVLITEAEGAWATVNLEPLRQETGRGPLPWVLTASAGAALAGAITFGVIALSTQDDFQASPTQSTLDRGERLNLTADALFLTSGIVGAAAAALFIFESPVAERESGGHVTGLGRRAPAAP